MDFEVIQGDIAQQSADVLVNAAGTSLQMGSGVAGALRRAAGEQMNEAAMEKGPVDLGEAAVTDGYGLDAQWVVHAAAMPHYGDGKATAQSIEDATRNALRRADKLEAESLVIPALGCGVAGFDLRDGAGLICDTVDAYEPSSLETVQFIAYADEEYEVVQAVADELWAPDEPESEDEADTQGSDAGHDEMAADEQESDRADADTEATPPVEEAESDDRPQDSRDDHEDNESPDSVAEAEAPDDPADDESQEEA